MSNSREEKKIESDDHRAVRPRRRIVPLTNDNSPSADENIPLNAAADAMHYFNQLGSMNFYNDSDDESKIQGEDDFTVPRVQYDIDYSDDENIPSAEVSMALLNQYVQPTVDDHSVQSNYRNDSSHASYDSDEEKTPFPSSLVFEDDTRDKESVIPIDQDKRNLFIKLATEIHANGTSHLLELPAYKPYKLAIVHGLNRYIREDYPNHAVLSAVVFLAQKNALHMAEAISLLLNYEVFSSSLTVSLSMQAGCLSLLDAGEDVEIIAKVIAEFHNDYRTVSYFNWNLEIASTYIHSLLKLKQAGIKLTYNLGVFIAKAFEFNRQEDVIESLIAIQAARMLTDHFYLTVDLYMQYDYLTKIVDLLVMLKDKISLTDEIINRIIMNGSYADRLIEDIKQLIEPSAEDINAVLISVSSEAETTLSPNALEFKNAGIPLTANLCMLLKKAEAFNDTEWVGSLIALEKAGIPTEHLQLTLAFSARFEQFTAVPRLLILLKNKINILLTNEDLDFVFKHETTASFLCRHIQRLINNGIKPTVEIIKALYACPDSSKSVTGLISLRTLLPPVMRMSESEMKRELISDTLPEEMSLDASEMKLPVLPLSYVINIIQCREVLEGCRMLHQYGEEIELIDDLIIQSMRLTDTDEMAAIFKAYVALKRDDLSLGEDQINDIACAIVNRNGSKYLQELMKTDHENRVAVVEHLKKERLLPLPDVLWNCVFSFYAPPPQISRPVCTVELVDDAQEQQPTTPRPCS